LQGQSSRRPTTIWSTLHNLKQIGSALLATVLWPLILIGINLHIH
jgi:hypothetical protein